MRCVCLIALLLISLFLTACDPAPVQTPVPTSLPPGTPHLVTAWTEAGNLYVWQTGDSFARRVASGGAIQPFVSPDGQRIAFTRGPAGAPDSLWMVLADGTLEQQLAGEGSPASYRGAQIGQVVWWDDTTLYFNTLKRSIPDSIAQHDLYRANVITRAVSMLLPPGEGGRISLSPGRSKIVLVSAGDYDKHNGRIRVIEAGGQGQPIDLLYFTGVATGAHNGFYPPIAWIENDSALIAAIPDKDLLYSEEKAEDAPETTLWRLPVDTPNGRETIGTISASFFGMPRWSDDGSHMLYLERINKDTFRIMQADGLGENPFEIDTGKAGEIDMPTWIPGTNQYFYTKGAVGHLMTASLDELPHSLGEGTILAPKFVTSERFVFMTPFNDIYDLRLGAIGQPDTILTELKGLVVFDAVWVTP